MNMIDWLLLLAVGLLLFLASCGARASDRKS